MHMIVANPLRPRSYRSPDAAISSSNALDAKLRTIADHEIAGKKITEVLCQDDRLTLVFDGGVGLNLTPRNGQMTCSFAESVAQLRQCNGDDEVLVITDGSTELWKRGLDSRKLVGSVVSRLFFADRMIYIYFRNRDYLICCWVLEGIDGRQSIRWFESE